VTLDPATLALLAIIAICLVLVGAILTPGPVGVNERGALLGAIAAVLFAIGWRIRRSREP
jgi:drug/metabolite transporter (DMT)-like permease